MMEKDKTPCADENADRYEKLASRSAEFFKLIDQVWSLPDFLDVDPKYLEYAINHPEKFQKEIPKTSAVIVKDEPSGHFISGRLFDHTEIILQGRGRKVYLTAPRDATDDILEYIGRKFTDFLQSKYNKKFTYYVVRDLKRHENDVVINELCCKNGEENKEIVEMFLSTLTEKYQDMLSFNLFRFNKDIQKPTKVNKQKVYEIVENSFYSQTEKYVPPSIRKSITINNFGICNIGGKFTTVAKLSEDYKNLIDFIHHIKNDKPEWYKVGEFIPKKLFVKMYNDRYGDNKNTRSLFALFRKYNLNEKFMSETKSKRVDLSEYGLGTRVFNSFKAK